MTVTQSVVRVDVSDVAPAGCEELAFEVLRPVGEARAALVCFAGSGMTRRYFDLSARGYSFAARARDQGFLVALADHPGTGESAAPADGWALTPRTVAATEAVAAERIIASVPDPPEVVIGVGHSVGAHLLIHQQALRRTYDALALLGWPGRGLPESLSRRDRSLAEVLGAMSDDALEAELVISARLRHDTPLPAPGPGDLDRLVASALPEDARAALAEARAPQLAVVGHAMTIGGTAARAAARVDVPVFIGAGSRDLARDPHALPGAFPLSGDITLFVMRGAGHLHNVEPGRAELWARVTDWAAGTARRKAR